MGPYGQRPAITDGFHFPTTATTPTTPPAAATTAAALQLKELVNQEQVALPVVNVKDFALVQLCKLQPFGEGSSQEHRSQLHG